MAQPLDETTTESVTESVTESPDMWVADLHDWLASRFFAGELSGLMAKLIVIGGTVVAAGLVLLIARLIIVTIIRKVVSRTRTKWDDFLVERRLFTRIAHLGPAIVVYLAAQLYSPPFFEGLFDLEIAVQRLAVGYMIVIGVLVCSAVLNAVSDIYGTLEVSRKNPINGFVQGAKLVVWLIGGVFLAAELTGKDPWGLVAGIGAVTAVVMLVFKDSILGLVASIQIFVNNLVHIGDWIEMPRYGVDGDVVDITLTTVKVKNFDNTFTTIPTYSIISESFKNWRGMQESGGRRIKRAVHIDMNSIRFCDADMLQRFEKFAFLSDYIQTKQQELADYNQQQDFDTSVTINGRRLTNIGTFRAYLKAYLNHHAKIHKHMTFLIRQLPPSDKGLPIEVYVFCKDIRWVIYEETQGDIFDHILAVVPEFDLRMYQNPTGNDFQRLAGIDQSSQT